MTSTLYTGPNRGLQIGNNHGSVTAEIHQSHTTEDIDRLCLRYLRCPDSLVVKNRLKETKDKLLPQSFEWIFQDPQYQSWQNGENVCLLWIKGGAGKGKTMMSIGIIEELSRPQHESTVVTYFFCQNADYELNTLPMIIKGLILQLVNQQTVLKQCLRRRWDTMNNRFDEDVTSWRALWNIFLEMLDWCQCRRIYIIVDGLDECQSDGMADFLKLLVRNGLDRPAKIKWMLTSRPFDGVERVLLAGYDQVQVSLELNSKHVFEAVRAYIVNKVNELSHYHRYAETTKRQIETELTQKAGGTFLWVSLVCKKLESVCQDEALTTIQTLPLGLPLLYDRMFKQLNQGEQTDVRRCMRLLKVMMLAHRPLKVEEVESVTGLSDEADAIKASVDRCASFIRMQENNIEFVHQSARDYLAGAPGERQSILDSHEHFGHDEIALSCLSHLSKRLKVNLMELPRPDSTPEYLTTLRDKKRNTLLASVDYAAVFWVQHLEEARKATTVQTALSGNGEAMVFLHTKLLEWLECFSLLNRLPKAIKALNAVRSMAKNHPSALKTVEDATRFLHRHYQTIANWPLQIYSSAIIFSPESSVVRKGNIDKIPEWLLKVPTIEQNWASLIHTLKVKPNKKWTNVASFQGVTGLSHKERTVAFSPNGNRIISGSPDNKIKLWDATTGELKNTLAGHSKKISALAFSPDGKQIVSGSYDRDIKLWDTTTGELQKILSGHSDSIRAVAFSPDGKQIVSGYSASSFWKRSKFWEWTIAELQRILVGHSGPIRTIFSPGGKQIAFSSCDKNILLWDTIQGELQKTLAGHSGLVRAVAFSPDGKQIVSGSFDRKIKVWDVMTGELQKTLLGHSCMIWTVAFSPDGKKIVSGSYDKKIKLWDATTGDIQMTLVGHSGQVRTVAFSPDGKQIASGSDDGTIKLWDTMTGNLQKTLGIHTSNASQFTFLDKVWTVAFSPDGKHIASSSGDHSIKLWDLTTGDEKIPASHSSRVIFVFFSPDGKQLTSISVDYIIKLWDVATGDLQKTLAGYHSCLKAPSYVLRAVISRPDFGPGYWDAGLESLHGFSVRNQWICYEGNPFLLLPLDFQPGCHDVRGDQVSFGCQNGRVLSFGFDRSRLQSIFTEEM